MFKPFRYLFPALIALITYCLLSPSYSFAAPTAWSGRCIANGDVATIQGFECLFANILQVIVAFAGLAFFIMFIIGGFNYLFSSNDEKKVATAASTLTMAIFGLIGVIASSFILRFIASFTGINVLDFIIPG
jgi:hypothetical protein